MGDFTSYVDENDDDDDDKDVDPMITLDDDDDEEESDYFSCDDDDDDDDSCTSSLSSFLSPRGNVRKDSQSRVNKKRKATDRLGDYATSDQYQSMEKELSKDLVEYS